jgi:hypothetical protein
LVKVSVNRFVLRRVETIRKEVEANTQKLRDKTIENLKEIFNAASKIAGGEIKHQRINKRMAKITLRQKRRWLLVAGCAAKTIKMVAINLDEKEIKTQLNELERLINQVMAKPETTNQKQPRPHTNKS